MTERELFDTYHKAVYRTCYYMLRNQQDAEDVCHDVFITVFRQNWHQIEQLRAWILRIAMNQCFNMMKKRKTERNKLAQLYEGTPTDKAADALVIEKSEGQQWQALLNELPDKLLAVVTLRYIGELSVAEIAATLQIPEGTVKSRLHKALKVMRKKLQHTSFSTLKGEKQFGTF